MKRKLYDQIKKLDMEEKMLIVVRGMRGTGKTYSVLEYVKKEYNEYFYIDSANNSDFSLFFKNSDPKSLRILIADFFHIEEEYLDGIPVVIDEPEGDISPEILLKYYEENFKLFILVSDRKSVDFLFKDDTNYGLIETGPLNFGDFLLAIDKGWYEEIIEGHLLKKRRIPELIHQELLDLYDMYMHMGGMPDVINEYLRLGSAENIREKQLSVRNSLWYGLSLLAEKRAELIKDKSEEKEYNTVRNYEVSSSKVIGLLEAVEKILEKENHKFMYSCIREGVSRRLYEKSLEYLISQGVLIKIGRLEKDSDTDFRLYYSDPAFFERPDNSKLSESIMIQGLYSSGSKILYYESGKGSSVNCAVMINGEIYPVDSHILGRGSIRSIRSHFGNKTVIRFSEENCRFDAEKITIPIYAAYALNMAFQV